MKIFTFILLFSLVLNALGASKLIYQTEVLTTEEKPVELPLINTGQYNKIRISARFNPLPYEDKKPSIIFSLFEENESAGFLARMNFAESIETFVYDAPTAQLKIKVEGQGKVKIRVWGVQ